MTRNKKNTPGVRDGQNKPRCSWCGSDSLYVRYHDTEWGVPVHDDRKHFEFLILEGAQAGLSWITILRKRENYRKAFANFNAARVARFSARDVRRLLGNAGIVRNRLKIAAAVTKRARSWRCKKNSARSTGMCGASSAGSRA